MADSPYVCIDLYICQLFIHMQYLTMQMTAKSNGYLKGDSENIVSEVTIQQAHHMLNRSVFIIINFYT